MPFRSSSRNAAKAELPLRARGRPFQPSGLSSTPKQVARSIWGAEH